MIHLNGYDLITPCPSISARFLGRAFQDPMMGTAATMGIEGESGVICRRGQEARLGSALRTRNASCTAKKAGNARSGTGEPHDQQGRFSRPAVSVSADPADTPLLRKRRICCRRRAYRSARSETGDMLQITEEIVARDNLTTLMVTHNMKNAIQYGNRLIMMDAGRVRR